VQTVREQSIIYSSSLSGKAGLLDETRQVLQQIAAGYSLDEVRRMVLDSNLLSKQSQHTRKAVWDSIRLRLPGIDNAERLTRLARIVTSSGLTTQTQNLILFYELCRSQPLIADLTTDCVYPLYTSGRSAITQDDVIRWLTATSATHSEIATWSPQTREKVARNYLSLARDFGLLTGNQRKQISQVYVPLPAFLYILYDLATQGLGARAIIESDVFHLLLIDNDDLQLLLAEANRADYIIFRRAGTIYDLRFNYPSIDEVLRHATREVSGA
jgi:hypothetical protein